MTIEIYDTTLRDGAQALGVSITQENHIALCKELDEFGVDYIELGWPVNMANNTELIDIFKICKPLVKRAKIVAFGSTTTAKNPADDKKISSLIDSGADYTCIFGKTHPDNIRDELKISLEDNLNVIKRSINFLKSHNKHVFYDAEHFFDGFISNKNYALATLLIAAKSGAERLILCDTKGANTPKKIKEITELTYNFLKEKGVSAKLGVHLHGDRGLELGAALELLPYISQVQGTMHGRGERSGNMSLVSFIANMILEGYHFPNINPKNLKAIYESSCFASGLEPDETAPFVGDAAFAHKGGVHQGAVGKNKSLYEHISPETFGNQRILPLNTLGGRSSIIHVASQFGYALKKNDPTLEDKVNALFTELKFLENQGYRLDSLKAEQFLLIEKYFGQMPSLFELDLGNLEIKDGKTNGKKYSLFRCPIKIGEEIKIIEKESNNGPIDAVNKALRETLFKKYHLSPNLNLADYHVGIARRGRMGEESTVRTLIYFTNDIPFKTVGVSSDILESGIIALTKAYQYHIWKELKPRNLHLRNPSF